MSFAVFAVVTLYQALPLLAAVIPRTGRSIQQPLIFKKDGTFQLSIFEDLNFGENAWDTWGPQQDINSVIVMNKILDKESQQLVVLNGDLITGENAHKKNASVYVDQIVAPLVNRSLTWASTYGNHDSAFNLSRQDIYAREHRWANSRTAQMVPGVEAGVTNYYLPVYGANCTTNYTSCAPELILWFFDSRGGHYFQQLNASGDEVGQPNWVDQSVVSWFETTSAKLTVQHKKTIPSLAFVHIPTNASLAAQADSHINAKTSPGIDNDIVAQQAQNWCPNGVADGTCKYGGQDVPFMKALVRTPGLMAIFSGHDHGDTWCYKWKSQLPGMTFEGNGVNLCFGQHSGYGGYGTWTRGSRQVFVTQEMLKDLTVETWIRLETGNVVGAVMLNSTYGADEYPATPDTHTNCPTCNYTIVTPMPGT